jgi:glycosyltransferase involved in cell wall biosynthesis
VNKKNYSPQTIKICALGALYNGDKPEYLHKCLHSISNQTLSIPIFIVVDGPIRNSLQSKLDDFLNLDINLIRLESNLGLARALSHAVNYLNDKFEYVIRFDSDDINSPDRFKKLHECILEKMPDLVSSHMLEIDENDEVFSERKVPIKAQDIKKKLPYRNPINHPASAFKISAVQASGGYREMPFFEDWYLWIRMSHAGYKIENIDEFLVEFRATDEMVARRYGLAYVKHEVNFFRRRNKEKLINPIENWLAFLARLTVKAFGFKAYKKVFYWIRK